MILRANTYNCVLILRCHAHVHHLCWALQAPGPQNCTARRTVSEEFHGWSACALPDRNPLARGRGLDDVRGTTGQVTNKTSSGYYLICWGLSWFMNWESLLTNQFRMELQRVLNTANRDWGSWHTLYWSWYALHNNNTHLVLATKFPESGQRWLHGPRVINKCQVSWSHWCGGTAVLSHPPWARRVLVLIKRISTARWNHPEHPIVGQDSFPKNHLQLLLSWVSDMDRPTYNIS